MSKPELDIINDLLTRPIPKHLWHYTSYKAFQGIVESKRMFASDLRFLNDSQEFVHAKKLAHKLAEDTLTLADGGIVHNLFIRALTSAFENGPLHPDRRQVMVASFSEARDQLSQWRGYSGASSGVSLSFDLSKIRPPAGNESEVVFAPCVYETSRKNALLERALSHMFPGVIQFIKDLKKATRTNPKLSNAKDSLKPDPAQAAVLALDENLKNAIEKVNYDLIRICPLLKDSSFSEEREWRLVLPISMDKHLKNPRLFRCTSDTLIPYIAYPLCGPDEPAPVNALFLGPGSHSEAAAATHSFLRTNQIMVMPELSRVPYRAS